ncbi:MAG: tRNA epoxyqueuosine(34) reductase QueG [Gammaproteobacteria bacterium]|uniref:Epoxyqueuosine reductase n=1 Tax=Tolumonas osonensis TaxID=675874 RepID=A0A841GG22_9GAMM|nr:tRNA epoxyqueuosine(34) reductase QueG [Tolumonas osonensis]MBB6055616.1 epoxyqueuosine reductase [Tolumonas osonensis]NCB59665.1 tRNA epoxyqueuosine(34) reductase QueG [Gammaproteobacteria bacterium]
MTSTLDLQKLAHDIKLWGLELGFDQVGITDCDLSTEESHLERWLANGYHGDMEYMARYGLMRARPAELQPGTRSVISVRMNYLPPLAKVAETLDNPARGYISRYALGRDYHKLLRNRLKQLGERIQQACSELQFRPFVDSAPIMERPLADKAGLGWTGKHTLLLNQQAGSFFFLGELLLDLPLPADKPVEAACGNCTACIQICPTGAIVAPYELDARRCISYLTIELNGSIPEEFRALIGNRIYGCDDCQLICPWNRYAVSSSETDFLPRQALHTPDLLTLWSWDENMFLKTTEGSAIRRIGFEKWQRNIAVALGNGPASEAVIQALQERRGQASVLVQEHIDWALQQLQTRQITDNKKQARLIRCIYKGLPAHA